MQIKGDNKRQNLRVPYPKSCRPILVIDQYQYEIIDISEFGVRFLCGTEQPALAPGTDIDAVLTLHDTKPFNVHGRLIRISERFSSAIMALTEKIPIEILLQEQRSIKKLFPGFLEE